MGRYSPTVLPEPIHLGDVLREGVQGFLGARQMKREDRSRKLQEEREERDENRYLRSLREGDLARPGGRDLGKFLGDPEAAQMTPETLKRVGRADQPTVPLAFERPAPTEMMLPDQSTITMQERAPYVTASGVVMDPSAARGEQTLSTALDEQMKRRFDEPQPWKPTTREEQIKFTRDTAAAGRAPEKPSEVAPPTLKAALEAIRAVYGTPGELEGDYTYPFSQKRLGELLGDLTGMDFPKIEGPQPEPVEPPAETSEGIGFWNSLRNKFVPGQPYGKEAAAPADTTGMRTALEPGKQAGEVTRYAAPSSPEVSPDLTLAQRMEMAKQEWEELVDAGTDPDEATKLLREKYGLPGGQ